MDDREMVIDDNTGVTNRFILFNKKEKKDD